MHCLVLPTTAPAVLASLHGCVEVCVRHSVQEQCHSSETKANAVPLLTTAPAFCATGPSFLLMEPPALNRAMSTPSKLQQQSSRYQHILCQ